jgi:hypothetical protein
MNIDLEKLRRNRASGKALAFSDGCERRVPTNVLLIKAFGFGE